MERPYDQIFRLAAARRKSRALYFDTRCGRAFDLTSDSPTISVVAVNWCRTVWRIGGQNDKKTGSKEYGHNFFANFSGTIFRKKQAGSFLHLESMADPDGKPTEKLAVAIKLNDCLSIVQIMLQDYKRTSDTGN